MTVNEAWNRGNNLLATGIAVLAGFSFFPEIFLEDEWQFKLDDLIILILGLFALWWYKTKNNRYTHSVVPVLIVVAGLVAKILAIILEFKDKEDVGDDFGALILFSIATVVVIYLYRWAKYESTRPPSS